VTEAVTGLQGMRREVEALMSARDA
jgi:hypothetical protein